MLSQTCEYALKAATYIARRGGDEPLSARDIAVGASIPHDYLQKLLTELVRNGVLTSSRGIGGGFRLAKSPDLLRLADVIVPFTNADRDRHCPFSGSNCDPRTPCAVHDRWGSVVDSLTQFLETTTLADLAHKGVT